MSQEINLYEARLRPSREWLGARLLGQAALAVLALVVGTAIWAHARSSAREAVAARTAAFDVLNSGRSLNTAGFSAIFKGFAQQAPENPRLWLTSFSVRHGGEAIEIRGRALDAAALPAYVQGLRRQPAFEGRRFAGLEMSDRSFKEVEVPGQAAVTKPQSPAGVSGNAEPGVVEFVLRSEAALDGGTSGTAERSGP